MVKLQIQLAERRDRKGSQIVDVCSESLAKPGRGAPSKQQSQDLNSWILQFLSSNKYICNISASCMILQSARNAKWNHKCLSWYIMLEGDTGTVSSCSTCSTTYQQTLIWVATKMMPQNKEFQVCKTYDSLFYPSLMQEQQDRVIQMALSISGWILLGWISNSQRHAHKFFLSSCSNTKWCAAHFLLEQFHLRIVLERHKNLYFLSSFACFSTQQAEHQIHTLSASRENR